MAEYKTKQKQMLSDFLCKNREKAFTIEEICEKMAAEGLAGAPAKSTVYRLIPRLVNEGIVRKIPAENSNTSVYQIIAGSHCKGHLHLKCSKCGKIIHLKERLSDELLGYIKAENGFSVSQKETIIFGQCSECN